MGWLKNQLGLLDVTPILPVLDMAKSVAFYEGAGFNVHVYRDESEEGGFAYVHYDEQSVFDLGLVESAERASCFISVPNSDEWHARFAILGYDITPLQDESWGMREFVLTDPNGNRLRFGHRLD